MGGICCKRKSQNSNANNGSTEVISSIDGQETYHESLRKGNLEPSQGAAVSGSLQLYDTEQSQAKDYKNKASKTEVTSVIIEVATDRAADQRDESESVTEPSSNSQPSSQLTVVQPELCDPEKSRTEEYKRTFTAYYARLCEALPVEEILPELVSNEVITVHEMEEILAEKTSIAKARALLNRHIFKGISAGCPEVLTTLLSVMRHLNDHTCKALSKEMCARLNIATSKDASFVVEVQFEYEAREPDELTIDVGDIIRNCKVLEDGCQWLEGELNGKRGLFPENFVVKLVMVEVQFEYEAMEPDELTIHVGDIIRNCKVLEDGCQWLEGELNGKRGLFPESCVVKLGTTFPSSDTNTAKSIQHLTHQMSNYQQHLKSKYEVLELSSPDEMLDCASTEYVDLTLITNNQRNRIKQVQDGKGVSLSEALNVRGQKKKIILIKGGPGMGKSTLAINICKRWAKGELLQAYDAVILLPLREKEVQEAKTIGDLLLILDDKMREDVTKEIVMNNGESICFLCEGFDELPIRLRKSSMVANLIQKLPKCTLIYTSRPEACSEIQSVDARVIAIDGFKEESIDEYISKTFKNIDNGKEMASQLKSEVKNNNWIRRILHVPINVAIVCLIFYHFSVLPDTLTQLYTLLFLRLILRHITTRTPNVAQIRQLTSLNNLPPDISEQFSQVCFIAYRGTVNGQAVFSSQDLCDMEVAENNMSGLGLLLITPSFSVYGRGKSFSFLHLTLQEFSAAWHLSKLPAEEQQHFKRLWFSDKYEMVRMFYSGITGLKNEELVHSMLPFTNKIVKYSFTDEKTADILLSVYEAQNSELCKIIGDYLEGSIYLNDSFGDKQQVLIHALGYFVMEYTGTLRLISLSNIYLSTEELTVLIESLKNRSKQLLHNKVLSSNLILKLCIARKVTFSSSLLNSLVELLENYPITEFYIYLLGVKDIQVLSQLLSNKNSLNILTTYRRSFNPPVCITNYNTSLCDLRITGCYLHDTVDEIVKVLSYCKSVVSVDFSFSNLKDNGVKILFNHLKNNNTLQHLNLSGNDITVFSIDELRKLMRSDPSVLTSIALSHNPLYDVGVCLFLQAVTDLDFMECIEFEEVSMTSSSYECVAKALHKVRSINFTLCDDSEIISNSIASAVMLKEIKLSGLEDSYCNIINGINQNKNIKTISFSYSYNDDDSFNNDSFTNLERLVRYNKSITTLNLSFNHEYAIFVPDIAGALTTESSINHLSMSFYDLYHSHLSKSFLDFLKKIPLNSTLEELVFNENDIYGFEGYDNQYCQDIFNYINSMQSTEHVTSPLKVSIYVDCH